LVGIQTPQWLSSPLFRRRGWLLTGLSQVSLPQPETGRSQFSLFCGSYRPAARLRCVFGVARLSCTRGLPGGATRGRGFAVADQGGCQRELSEVTGLVVWQLRFLALSSGPEFVYTYLNGDRVETVTAVYQALQWLRVVCERPKVRISNYATSAYMSCPRCTP